MAAPSLPVISFFDPPAENPLSEGGRWEQTNPLVPPLRKTALNEATDTVHGNANYSHYARERYDSSNGVVEAWGCTAGGQLGAALETWRVALWIEVGTHVSGYLVYYGGGIGKSFAIRRYDSGGFTGIGGGSGGYPDKLGVVIDGDDVQAWGQYGGAWTLIDSVADTTYRGKFYAGLGIEDPTGGGLSFPCFGAGVPGRSQFFRWTRGWKRP